MECVIDKTNDFNFGWQFDNHIAIPEWQLVLLICSFDDKIIRSTRHHAPITGTTFNILDEEVVLCYASEVLVGQHELLFINQMHCHC